MAWRTCPLCRIFATAYRANYASVRVMQKLGMRQVRVDDDEVEYEVNLPGKGL